MSLSVGDCKMAKSTNIVAQIKKSARRKLSADGKIRIVLEGLRGEIEGISPKFGHYNDLHK